MGVRGAWGWLVLGIVIGLVGCAPRVTIEEEPPVTRTWVGNKPPPEPAAQADAAPTEAPGAAADPSTAPASDAAVVAPAVDPNAPATANTEPPPTRPAKRSGWVKAGSWNR